MSPTILRQLAVLLLAAVPLAHAALDSDAHTDDHSINTPTDWWVFTGLTPLTLAAKVDELGARPVGIEITGVSNATPTMTVRLVRNAGAYAIPGAGWVWNLSQEALSVHLASTRSRPIEVARYDAGGGNWRWVAVTVPDSGATARSWGWLPGHSESQIRSWVNQRSHRIIDIDSFGSGSGQRYSVLTVANSDADYKTWDWGVGRTPAQIDTLNRFGGRLVKLVRQGDGRYAYVQVDNQGVSHSDWWRVYGLRSATELTRYAAQMGARPVDLVRYSSGGSTLYDAVFIDNLDADSRRVRGFFLEGSLAPDGMPVGITQAHLRRADSGQVLVHFNASRRAESASVIKLLHLLHAMSQVNAGDNLRSRLTYYNYPTDSGVPAYACPDPRFEGPGQGLATPLESGLDRMMSDSDNRMARGVVLRYGGFDPINATAAAAGMVDTQLRHNDGCAYLDPVQGRYAPATLRNETSASDLTRLWAGVKGGGALPPGSLGQREFLESVRALPVSLDTALVGLIHEQAAAMGKSAAVADAFVSRSLYQVQGGKYETCLGEPTDDTQCGQKVVIRAVSGLLSLPSSPQASDPGTRYYAYASMMSDMPVTSYDDSAAQQYRVTLNNATLELFRPAIRECLQAW
jgi:hypothetical protein